MDIKRVCIDAGHATGNKNYGHGYYEYEGNWRRANALADEFRRRGVEVLMTKTSVDDDPSLTKRGTAASMFHADLFISIHSDASGSPSKRGVHIIRSIHNPDSADLGLAIVKAVAKAMDMPVRESPVWTRTGTKDKTIDYYTVINRSANYLRYSPKGKGINVKLSYLIEIGYHTNAIDAKILADKSYDRKFAVAFADTVLGKEEDEDLRKGDKGIEVQKWQERLIEWNGNALPVHKADASFGSETEDWTNNFKAKFNLPQDGVVDALAWNAMVDALKAKPPNEMQVGDRVYVTGRGWASSYKTGSRTNYYGRQPMMISRIVKDAKAPYGMEQSGWIVGWFDETQLSW